MNIRILYLATAVVFCVSIPVAVNLEKIALLFNGSGVDLAFKRYHTTNDEEMIDSYYYAWKEAFPIMRYMSFAIVTIWAATFVLSVLVWIKSVVIPYRLEILTALVSLGFLVVNLLPYVIYGSSWPPRVL